MTSELPYDLLVSTPTGKLVRTSQVYVKCSFQIENKSFTANLICLPLSGLDVILGMDWLSANRVMLNCSKKSIVFPSTLFAKPVTSMCLYLNCLVFEHCKVESQEYIHFLASEMELDQVLAKIPVVREFPDVFPKDIPEFPSEREIEFSIELVPRMGPISIAPHQMSPLELAELKK